MSKDLWFGTSGPRDAEIVLVGEAWGFEETLQEKPFVGSSGTELTRILSEAGIDRSTILLTNVAAARPQNNEMWRFFHDKEEGEAQKRGVRGLHPTDFLLSELQRLDSQLRSFPRKCVIASGNYALWATSEHTGYTSPPDAQGRRVPSGIVDHRGSMWYLLQSEDPRTPLLPIIHPAAIMRQWTLRAITVHDLKSRVPLALRGEWRPVMPPEFTPAPPDAHSAVDFLEALAGDGEARPVVLDVETCNRSRIITCVGFAESKNAATSIPFVRPNGKELENYWRKEDEIRIVAALCNLLRSPSVLWVGQNLSYDIQVLWEWLGVAPRLFFDTMLAHHLLFPGVPKALDYIASLYCTHYWYWKEDSKEWDIKNTGLTDLLLYNCMDCVRTFECFEELKALIERLGFEGLWQERLALHELALRMMFRGVRVDQKRQAEFSLLLMEQADEISSWLLKIIPQEWSSAKSKVPWYNSPTQQKEIFGERLGLKIPFHRKTGRPTLGKEGLDIVRSRYPELTTVFEAIEALRSLETFNSHFIRAELEPNGRMRCSFNVAGTETFRWSSSKNPFQRGTNLQNIPEGSKEEGSGE